MFSTFESILMFPGQPGRPVRPTAEKQAVYLSIKLNLIMLHSDAFQLIQEKRQGGIGAAQSDVRCIHTWRHIFTSETSLTREVRNVTPL